MFTLTDEQLQKLKTFKLPGELKLTHKPVVPNLQLFLSRPEEFLNELRTIRENLAFKVGPSKKRKTVSAASGLGDDVQGETDLLTEGEQGTPKTRRKITTPKKASASLTTAAQNSDVVKNWTPEEQAMLFAALGQLKPSKARKGKT